VGHLLMLALRADHASKPAFLSEQRASVEDPLHEALPHAEHRELEPRALRILQVARIDRLVGELEIRLRHHVLRVGRPTMT
jgi:hypothetical protein